MMHVTRFAAGTKSVYDGGLFGSGRNFLRKERHRVHVYQSSFDVDDANISYGMIVLTWTEFGLRLFLRSSIA